MATDQEYVKQLKEQVQGKDTNYVKFNNGERKVLEFVGDAEHAFIYEDPRFGKRNRFIVTDFTDAMKPIEGMIWDVSKRWANMVLSYLEKNKEMLEITRQGTGMGTQYQILPAITE